MRPGQRRAYIEAIKQGVTPQYLRDLKKQDLRRTAIHFRTHKQQTAQQLPTQFLPHVPSYKIRTQPVELATWNPPNETKRTATPNQQALALLAKNKVMQKVYWPNNRPTPWPLDKYERKQENENKKYAYNKAKTAYQRYYERQANYREQNRLRAERLAKIQRAKLEREAREYAAETIRLEKVQQTKAQVAKQNAINYAKQNQIYGPQKPIWIDESLSPQQRQALRTQYDPKVREEDLYLRKMEGLDILNAQMDAQFKKQDEWNARNPVSWKQYVEQVRYDHSAAGRKARENNIARAKARREQYYNEIMQQPQRYPKFKTPQYMSFAGSNNYRKTTDLDLLLGMNKPQKLLSTQRTKARTTKATMQTPTVTFRPEANTFLPPNRAPIEQVRDWDFTYTPGGSTSTTQAQETAYHRLN